jgi:hypothetical protein
MSDRIARIWNGSSWESISSPVTIPNAFAYYNSASPSGPFTGEIWIDSDANSLSISNEEYANAKPGFVWTGSEWVPIGLIIGAKYQSSSPTNPAIGDIWIDSNTNVLYAWSGTEWVEGFYRAEYSASAPSNPFVGKLWIDSDTNLFYIWDGDSWIQTQTLSSYQEEEPEDPTAGQTWIRSTDRQSFVYDSLTGWRRVRDNSPIKFNYDTLDENITILGDRNAFSVGPILIDEETEVTIDGDAVWCIL